MGFNYGDFSLINLLILRRFESHAWRMYVGIQSLCVVT
jgi:hypothetical protein